MSRGTIVLLGSGETAPGMVKVHRDLLNGLERVRAVNLDTSYGFQENVPQMTEKLVDYFDTSLRTRLETIHFPSFAAASDVERALVKRQVRDATYVFAGPGSPSYALAQWRPLGLRDDLEAVLAAGGVVCFASAAALTLGSATVPVYEIYKAGADPHWLEGLDLMAVTGLSCVVIPHFDNAEGATHDTRFCYLGERRLLQLERELPADVATLGIDEHTAVVIDLAQRTLHVRGRSQAYWRLNGSDTTLGNGTTTPLDDLGAVAPRADGPGMDRHGPLESLDLAAGPTTPEQLAARASAGGPDAADALAQLLLLARDATTSSVDGTPIVESLLVARSAARERRDFALSDALRDALLGAGVEINDGATGTTWSLRPRSA